MMGMGGMGMGGMGMGGMGGGMGMGGMMGGGMRSVPATGLPFAELKSKQTRHLPTRLVSLSPPDPEAGVSLPEKGEPLQIVGDVGRVNHDPRVQKALKRLAAAKAPTTVSQLVMWRLAGGLSWDDIARLSERWANPFELTLARDFCEQLDGLQPGEAETGSLRFQISGTDAAGESKAAELVKTVQGKTVLGLRAELGIPARPDGPALACRVRFSGGDALVQVLSSDGAARSWLSFAKFTLPATNQAGEFEPARFADALAEGVLNRVVRAQLIKGPRDKSKPTYQLRIENFSPMLLNGLALQGPASKPADAPKVLSGISISPRKAMTVPASEEAVKLLGLKQGVRVLALDLSGL